MKLFVGNLSFETTENDLQDAFERCGTVSEVKLMTDRMTGRSRGFAFVTMGSSAEGETAIREFDGKELGGRPLRVNEARPREEFGGGGGGGGGGRGGNRGDSRPKRSFGGGGGGRQQRW